MYDLHGWHILFNLFGKKHKCGAFSNNLSNSQPHIQLLDK